LPRSRCVCTVTSQIPSSQVLISLLARLGSTRFIKDDRAIRLILLHRRDGRPHIQHASPPQSAALLAWNCRDLRRLDIFASDRYVHVLADHFKFLRRSRLGLAPLTISSSTSGSLYNINDFTCGISKSYQVAYMLLYFLPVRTPLGLGRPLYVLTIPKLFLASLLSALVYSLIFLMLRGTLVINGGLKIQIGPESRLRVRDRTFQGYQRFVHTVAQKMLW
jgi:hypothetical protein